MAFEAYEDQKLLRRIQLVLVKILEEFDRICHELDIPYTVYGGSTIGAIRHRGFIPWDDDVDVCMTRVDYERFLREAPQVLREEFAIENSRTHADFPNMFSFLTLRETLFIPEFIKKSSYRMPLKIDIFPLDNVANDPKDFARQRRATWFWGRMLYLQGTPAPVMSLTGVTRKIALSATFLVYWSLRITRVSPRFLQHQWEKAARRYEGESSKAMADFAMGDPENWAVSYLDLYPARDMPFENIIVKVPREYDAVLRKGYGDYMQLPPVDQRKNHQPFLIDLGKYSEEDPF